MVFKRELEKQIADLEDKLANADYQLEGRDNEIRELTEKVEKMKCCENCRYREPYCEEAIRLPFGCHCEKWELKI